MSSLSAVRMMEVNDMLGDLGNLSADLKAAREKNKFVEEESPIFPRSVNSSITEETSRSNIEEKKKVVEEESPISPRSVKEESSRTNIPNIRKNIFGKPMAGSPVVSPVGSPRKNIFGNPMAGSPVVSPRSPKKGSSPSKSKRKSLIKSPSKNTSRSPKSAKKTPARITDNHTGYIDDDDLCEIENVREIQDAVVNISNMDNFKAQIEAMITFRSAAIYNIDDLKELDWHSILYSILDCLRSPRSELQKNCLLLTTTLFGNKGFGTKLLKLFADKLGVELFRLSNPSYASKLVLVEANKAIEQMITSLPFITSLKITHPAITSDIPTIRVNGTNAAIKAFGKTHSEDFFNKKHVKTCQLFITTFATLLYDSSDKCRATGREVVQTIARLASTSGNTTSLKNVAKDPRIVERGFQQRIVKIIDQELKGSGVVETGVTLSRPNSGTLSRSSSKSPSSKITRSNSLTSSKPRSVTPLRRSSSDSQVGKVGTPVKKRDSITSSKSTITPKRKSTKITPSSTPKKKTPKITRSSSATTLKSKTTPKKITRSSSIGTPKSVSKTTSKSPSKTSSKSRISSTTTPKSASKTTPKITRSSSLGKSKSASKTTSKSRISSTTTSKSASKTTSKVRSSTMTPKSASKVTASRRLSSTMTPKTSSQRPKAPDSWSNTTEGKSTMFDSPTPVSNEDDASNTSTPSPNASKKPNSSKFIPGSQTMKLTPWHIKRIAELQKENPNVRMAEDHIPQLEAHVARELEKDRQRRLAEKRRKRKAKEEKAQFDAKIAANRASPKITPKKRVTAKSKSSSKITSSRRNKPLSSDDEMLMDDSITSLKITPKKRVTAKSKSSSKITSSGKNKLEKVEQRRIQLEETEQLARKQMERYQKKERERLANEEKKYADGNDSSYEEDSADDYRCD